MQVLVVLAALNSTSPVSLLCTVISPLNVSASQLSPPILSQLEPSERRVQERSPRKANVVPDLLYSIISSLYFSIS